jgi:hypothetical protein
MSKAPNIPSGSRVGSKGASKPMSPMPAAKPSRPGTVAPNGSSTVNPSRQSQTREGGARK